MIECRHGIEPEWCSVCREEEKDRHFVPDLIPVGTDRIPALLLSEPNARGLVRVMVDDPATPLREVYLEEVKKGALAERRLRDEAINAAPVESREQVRKIVDEFQSATGPVARSNRSILRVLALTRGYLFERTAPLTRREDIPSLGPSNCWHCPELLSHDRHSLGCTKCRYYVCSKGRCMCGFPGGYNYLDQFVPPGPGLPCDPDERRYYMRVVRHLSADGFVREIA